VCAKAFPLSHYSGKASAATPPVWSASGRSLIITIQKQVLPHLCKRTSALENPEWTTPPTHQHLAVAQVQASLKYEVGLGVRAYPLGTRNVGGGDVMLSKSPKF